MTLTSRQVSMTMIHRIRKKVNVLDVPRALHHIAAKRPKSKKTFKTIIRSTSGDLKPNRALHYWEPCAIYAKKVVAGMVIVKRISNLVPRVFHPRECFLPSLPFPFPFGVGR